MKLGMYSIHAIHHNTMQMCNESDISLKLISDNAWSNANPILHPGMCTLFPPREFALGIHFLTRRLSLCLTFPFLPCLLLCLCGRGRLSLCCGLLSVFREDESLASHLRLLFRRERQWNIGQSMGTGCANPHLAARQWHTGRQVRTMSNIIPVARPLWRRCTLCI